MRLRLASRPSPDGALRATAERAARRSKDRNRVAIFDFCCSCRERGSEKELVEIKR